LRSSCLNAPTPPDFGDILGLATRFFTTNTALRAVKETEKHDDSHVDLTRQCGKPSVIMSSVLHCVYFAWKHPCRRIEEIFQDCRPAFPPRTRPCVRSKRLKSTMTRTLTSPDNAVSPPLQLAQFSIAFILPRSTHARRIEEIFQDSRPTFSPRTRPYVRSKRLSSTMNRTLTSLDSVVSPQ